MAYPMPCFGRAISGRERCLADAALSILLFLVAAALSWSLTRALHRQFRIDAAIGEEDRFVRSGPYRLMRKPHLYIHAPGTLRHRSDPSQLAPLSFESRSICRGYAGPSRDRRRVVRKKIRERVSNL